MSFVLIKAGKRSYFFYYNQEKCIMLKSILWEYQLQNALRYRWYANLPAWINQEERKLPLL